MYWLINLANLRRKKYVSKNMFCKKAARFHHITPWASILLPNEALTQNCIQSALSPVIGTLNCRSLNILIPQCLRGVRHQGQINPSPPRLHPPGCFEEKKSNASFYFISCSTEEFHPQHALLIFSS